MSDTLPYWPLPPADNLQVFPTLAPYLEAIRGLYDLTPTATVVQVDEWALDMGLNPHQIGAFHRWIEKKRRRRTASRSVSWAREASPDSPKVRNYTHLPTPVSPEPEPSRLTSPMSAKMESSSVDKRNSSPSTSLGSTPLWTTVAYASTSRIRASPEVKTERKPSWGELTHLPHHLPSSSFLSSSNANPIFAPPNSWLQADPSTLVPSSPASMRDFSSFKSYVRRQCSNGKPKSTHEQDLAKVSDKDVHAQLSALGKSAQFVLDRLSTPEVNHTGLT